MIPVETALNQFRRHVTLGTWLKAVMLGLAGACALIGPMLGAGAAGLVALCLIGGVWLALSYHSAQGSRVAADSPALIAAGQFDEAEHRIERALRTFSLFRTAKLMSLHHLALLRHAQGRWQESAVLCRALLRQRLGSMQGLSKPSRLMLADALLEMDDVHGAYDALMGLYRQRLTLGEALHLLVAQLDYCGRIGAWEPMIWGAGSKAQLAELLPAAQAARVQAWMALAAKKTGRSELAQWLRRRAELLADPNQLASQRPMLGALWEKDPAEQG